MERRAFLATGLATLSSVSTSCVWADRPATAEAPGTANLQQDELAPDVRAVIPVVGDGKWIWTKPPKTKGYQEPREFSLSIGIELRGRGSANQIKATTAVPVEYPEQRIVDGKIDTRNCSAGLRQLGTTAGQLMLTASSIVARQTIGAVAHFRLTLKKHYQGFEKDQFPELQDYHKDFKRHYMYDSPGIQTRDKRVKQLAGEIADKLHHPWDKAKSFYEWVWQTIKPRIQFYTSVIAAIRDRVGDCEERAAVFVALCRASGIPARLVWVPGHNWAEFYLIDYQGRGHWIPSHTSAYSWFSWTGAHEVILQKGDSIRVPEKRKPQRLMADWMQWQGARPEVRYFANITPIPASGSSDPGPGARRKQGKGQWVPTGKYAKEKFTRQ